MSMNLVQPYNPEWPVWFDQIRAALEAALDGAHLDIEHVGSTAVPGMSAKPIIDIDIVIANDRFEVVKESLTRLGYDHRGDLGIIGREAFGLTDDQPLKAQLPPHHLYVCPEESPELKRHLYFREWLKRNQPERDYYAHKKMLIAELCDHDRRMYAQVKEIVLAEFFDQLLQGLESGD
jgi:GrpB-like predicted nucleotidyltransferase (UPF0157 family)